MITMSHVHEKHISREGTTFKVPRRQRPVDNVLRQSVELAAAKQRVDVVRVPTAIPAILYAGVLPLRPEEIPRVHGVVEADRANARSRRNSTRMGSKRPKLHVTRWSTSVDLDSDAR